MRILLYRVNLVFVYGTPQNFASFQRRLTVSYSTLMEIVLMPIAFRRLRSCVVVVVAAAANRLLRETALRRCNTDDDIDLVVVVVVA